MADQSVNIEDLSDDEILKLGPEGLAAMAGGAVQAETGEGEGADTQETATQAEVPSAADAAANQDDGDDKNDDKAAENAATGGTEAGTSVDATAPAVAATADKAAPAAAEQAKVTDKAGELAKVDYEAQVKAILAPFKANGREIKVETPEDARQLMRMGANYNKKMAGMKPHLTTLRMLENAGINQENLGYLIDLHKKDPAAINRLVQDSKIDPMDLSAEKAAGYTPGDHRPSDSEVALDAVLSELEGSEGYARTLDVVTTKFDSTSKKVVAQNPGLLKVINAHVESGIYDLIHAEMERQRVFGGLSGLSDLEAYRQVGDALHADGKFAHLGAGQPQQGQQTPSAQTVAVPDPKKADDSKRNEARRAVAPVKAAAPSGKGKPDFNPLSMSDEEFAKLGGKF